MMTDVQTTHPLFQVLLLLLLLCTPTHVRDTRRRSRSEQAANQSDDALIEPWAEVNAEQFRNPALSFCVSIINPWLALIARARSIRTQLRIWRRRLHRFLSLTLSHYLSLSLVFMSFKSRFSLPNKPNIWWQSIRLPPPCLPSCFWLTSGEQVRWPWCGARRFTSAHAEIYAGGRRAKSKIYHPEICRAATAVPGPLKRWAPGFAQAISSC